MSLKTYEPPANIPEAPGVPAFLPKDLFAHDADRHLRLLDSDGTVRACASIWWRTAPPIPDEHTGVIGHYYAASPESGAEILRAALKELRDRNATVAIGPMDGNTWRRYRFVTLRYDEPPFFLEPDQPDDWPGHFLDAGFHALARYSSALMTRLDTPDPRLEKARKRMTDRGIVIRKLNTEDFDGDLRRIHRISAQAFQENFLYTPLSEKAFLDIYLPIQSIVEPETVLVAEEDRKPVGFAFAVPDLTEQQRTGGCRTLILKSLAVLPGRRYAGLGTLLAGEIRQRAFHRGYTRLIHALMHRDNNSKNLAKTDAKTIREYTLYARRLSPSSSS